MADTNDVINVTQSEFQKLVGQDAGSVCKSKERMIRKDSAQTHRPSMEDTFMTQAAEAGMTMYDLDLLSYDDVTENWEEREYSRKSGLSVYNEEWDVIDFEAICEIPHAGTAFICMSNDYHFMPAVDKLLHQATLDLSHWIALVDAQ